MRYNIYNATTGKDLGTWEGATSGEAITTMASSAGFADFVEACALDAKYRGELVTTAVGTSEGRKEQVAHTPSRLPWSALDNGLAQWVIADANGEIVCELSAAGDDVNAALIVRAVNSHQMLMDALKEARRAIGMHNAPNDCYATGPMTGDEYRDLVQCPACSAIAMYDAALTLAGAA